MLRLTSRRQETNTQSSKEAAGHEERDGGSSSLQDNAKAEHKGLKDHGDPTTEIVGYWGSAESTEEGTSGEKGNDHGGLGGSDIGKVIFGVGIAG